MEDLEILKRIYEIENWTYGLDCFANYETQQPDTTFQQWTKEILIASLSHWNPLIDNGACLDLIKRHNLMVEPNHTRLGKQWVVSISDSCSAMDSDLNKAVCLAVIEAKNN